MSDIPVVMQDRLFLSLDGLWCDRAKPSGEVDETDGPLYAECEPDEVCNELTAYISVLRTAARDVLAARETKPLGDQIAALKRLRELVE